MAKSTPSIHCTVKPGTICIPCSEVCHLDESIREAKSVLEQLEARRKSMDSVLNQHHDPFIHRLPAEIAAHIFQICCPVGISTSFDKIHDDRPAQDSHTYYLAHQPFSKPLVLAAVCRYWRAVAFSTPKLWNIISIMVRNPMIQFRLPIIREWLDRSAALPLHVDLQIRIRNFEEHFHLLLTKVIQLLNDYSSRWLTLSIAVPSNLLNAFRCTTSSILSAVHIFTYPLPGQTPQPVDFGTLTRPTMLDLRLIQLKEVNFDYRKLVNLSCWDVTTKEIIQLANDAPQLETLLILGELTEDPHDNQLTPTTHHHVRKFQLQRHPPVAWELLTMPSVRNLIVNDEDQSHPDTCWPRVQQFLKRSQCHLTRLDINGHNHNYGPIFDFLCDLPELESLEIQHLELPEAFFRHMHDTASLDPGLNPENAGGDPFLPRLQSFSYVWIRRLTWSWVPLLIPSVEDVGIKTRPLTTMSFSLSWDDCEVEPSLDGDTLKYILDARDRGLAIEMSSLEHGDVVRFSLRGNDDPENIA